MKRSPQQIFILVINLCLIIIVQACTKSAEYSKKYYIAEDFFRITKIDAHVHVLTENTAFMQQAEKDNFVVISLNTEVPGYPLVSEQKEFAIHQQKLFPERFYFLAAFETDSRNDADWSDHVITYLKESFSQGAIGVKVWKNIGMVIKNAEGAFIMIDDPLFDPIFDLLERQQIPVCGHIGEPRNCWLPLKDMTVNGDKQYFSEHPEYHMYLHPEYPSYEEQIASRDRLLEKHPKLRFVGAHLGSMEWSVDEIAKRLDKFPNMAVDLTERICHLQYQSIDDWQKVYDFCLRYQDRILYGTDLATDFTTDTETLKKHMHEIWLTDWKYFTSDAEMEVSRVNGKFRGLKLPANIVDKIYYKNAVSWYPDVLPASNSSD